MSKGFLITRDSGIYQKIISMALKTLEKIELVILLLNASQITLRN
jgi:hypothetical protein